ncbi:MAG: hypothetical protein KIPDCIKN_00344 [Haliscomenobacter sp.]|jgi:predicted CoA-binding protein|nr:hypothetical protein [Haliscomenobacter sp.]
MENKKTLVLGASANPDRVSYEAVARLRNKGIEVVAIGQREGEIFGVPVLTGRPVLPDIDTVTLYLNPDRQKAYYEYILSLKPRRVIFNPGTENAELIRKAREAGIEPLIACTLVMLAINNY